MQITRQAEMVKAVTFFNCDSCVKKVQKFFDSSRALMGLKISPALLKSLWQAAGAGKGVLSFSDKLHTAGKYTEIT